MPRFVFDTGIVANETNTLFCEFAKFLSTQPGMYMSKWNNYFNWFQWELDNQVGSHNKLMPVAHVYRLKTVDDEAHGFLVNLGVD